MVAKIRIKTMRVERFIAKGSANGGHVSGSVPNRTEGAKTMKREGRRQGSLTSVSLIPDENRIEIGVPVFTSGSRGARLELSDRSETIFN